MRARAVPFVLALAALAGLGVAACELLLPTVLKEDLAEADVAPRCALAHEPLPPAPEAAGQQSGTSDLVYAIKTVSFDNKDGGLGLDLDGKCTCGDAGTDPIGVDASAEACRPPQTRPPLCDSLQGSDVSANTFLGTYLNDQLAAQTEEGDIDTRIGKGLLSILFELKNYTVGIGDRTGISLGLYNATGLFRDEADPDAGTRAPAWDGNDRWSIDCGDSNAFCSKDTVVQAAFFDPNAYQRGQTLVGHPASITLNLAVTDLRVTQPTVFATIKDDGSSLAGQIVGRILLRDMLTSLAAIHQGSIDAGKFYCGQQELFRSFLRPQLCKAVDLPGDPALGSQCNAISVALRFEAFPAKLGRRLDRLPIVRGCDEAAYADDCTKLP